MVTRRSFRMAGHHTLILITAFTLSLPSIAQDCKSILAIELLNMNGGVYSGQKVTLHSKKSPASYAAISDSKGVARFDVPCNTYFDVFIPNYSKKLEVLSVEIAGGTMEQTLTYASE